MTSSAKVAGGDIQLSVDRATASAELQQLRAEVRSTFAGMSDDALKFASAQDRLDRALKQSNGKITSSVRSAELNLRRVQAEANKSSAAVVEGSNRSSVALDREARSIQSLARGALAGTGVLGKLRTALVLGSSSFLGGYGLAFLFRQVVDEASQVQEETEKTGIVFGKNAADVQAWSRTLAASFGVGEGAALKAAGVFGNMFRPLHIGEAEAAAMSKRLVELAADMASFNNASPAEVLQALSSGLAGQVRPLRQYGVFLSAARIQEEALADGIAKRGEKLTQAQKVQAAYNIILKDTKLQQGDVARNTESLSVAESKLRAGIENLEAGIARGLLPSLVAVTNRGADWLNNSRNQERVQHEVAHAADEVAKAAHGVADAYHAVAPAVRIVNRLLGGTENTAKLLVLAFAANKLGLLPTVFNAIRTSIRGVGASAVTTTAELNTMAAAEQRAAAAGQGINAYGGVGNAPYGPVAPGPFGNAPGGGLPAGIKAIPLFFLGGVRDVIPNHQWKDGEIITQKGVRFRAVVENGKLVGFVKESDWKAQQAQIAAIGNATTGDQLNPRAGVPGSPAYVPPGSKPQRRPLTLQARINLANYALTRAETTKDTTDDLEALRDLVALLRKQIAQGGTLAQQEDRYGQLKSALDQIASIDEQQAQAAKAARDRKAAAQAKAHRAALKAHQQALASRLGGIETDITSAQTAEGNARTEAQLKLAQQRERRARERLIAFYVQESKDPQLTKAARATAAKNAAKARQDLSKLDRDDRAAQLKFAVELAQNTVLQTTKGTAAYDRAEAAYKKALQREIDYYAAQAKRRDISLAEKRKDVAAELAARKQLAAEDKKTKTATGGAAENQRQFLADVQRIIGAYAPNAFPVTPPVSTGKLETHGYDTVNELRNIRAHLRDLVSRNSFPASAYQGAATVAALG